MAVPVYLADTQVRVRCPRCGYEDNIETFLKPLAMQECKIVEPIDKSGRCDQVLFRCPRCGHEEILLEIGPFIPSNALS